MKKIKIAQLGIEHDHAPAAMASLRQNPDLFEVVGYSRCGCERNVGPMYDGIPEMSPEELLAIPGLEAVTVETYELELTHYAAMAIERGLHVHMDKPGAADSAEFDRMVDLAESKGLVFHTGYMYRYNPFVTEAMEKIARGDYGEIYAVEAHMSCPHVTSKRQWLEEFPGGMLFFLGCHLVDLVFRIQGYPEKIIPMNCCTGIDGVTAQDYGFCAFVYKNGVSFVKSCASEPGGFPRRQLVICGSRGTCEIKPLEASAPGEFFSSQYTERSETFADPDGKTPWGRRGEIERSEVHGRYQRMMTAFASYVRGEKENPFTYDYEKRLHKMVLASCGVDIDWKVD